MCKRIHTHTHTHLTHSGHRHTHTHTHTLIHVHMAYTLRRERVPAKQWRLPQQTQMHQQSRINAMRRLHSWVCQGWRKGLQRFVSLYLNLSLALCVSVSLVLCHRLLSSLSTCLSLSDFPFLTLFLSFYFFLSISLSCIIITKESS